MKRIILFCLVSVCVSFAEYCNIYQGGRVDFLDTTIWYSGHQTPFLGVIYTLEDGYDCNKGHMKFTTERTESFMHCFHMRLALTFLIKRLGTIYALLRMVFAYVIFIKCFRHLFAQRTVKTFHFTFFFQTPLALIYMAPPIQSRFVGFFAFSAIKCVR